MDKDLIYKLEKEYDRFKLFKVYKPMIINGKAEEVYLYKTTTSKIKTKELKNEQ